MSDQNLTEAQSIDSSVFIFPPKSDPPKFTNLPEDGKISVQENNSLVIDIDASDDLDTEGSGLRYSIFPFLDIDLDLDLDVNILEPAGQTFDASALSTNGDIDSSVSIFPFIGDSDANFFTIDEKTGELSFKIPPDFETPVDLNGDNIYNITVRVTDSSFGSDYQSLKIKVTDEPGDPPTDFNYQPIANNDWSKTLENQSVKINVLANDRDPDSDILKVDSVQNPRNGSAVINDDGTITYTPNSNFSGNDSFEYKIVDGEGGTDKASVNVFVQNVNQKPNAEDDFAETNEGEAVKINVLANDSDPDGDKLRVSLSSPLAFSINNNGGAKNGKVVVNSDNTITYTPNDGFSGTDTFTYYAIDRPGFLLTAITDDGSVSGSINAESTGNLVDVGGSLNLEGNGSVSGSFSTDSDGSVSGSISTDGITTDAYFPIIDFGLSDSATVTVEVKDAGDPDPVNKPPVAVNDSGKTQEGESITIDVLANDSDPDGDSLTIDSVKNPSNGKAVINDDNTITYTPNDGFDGNDSFTYKIADGNGGTDEAKVNIAVEDVVINPPVNKLPVAVNDSGSTKEGESITIDVLANDSDPDGDSLTIDSVKNPSNGKAVINDDNTITYTPNDGFDGNDSFTYKIADGNGGTDEAKVNIAVEDVVITNPPTYTNFIKGTKRNNHLKGTNQNDFIEGLEGWDTLNGNGGDDYLSGGAGLDRLNGGAGADILNGSDSENAGAGERDILSGGADEDTFILGEANKSYYTDKGNRDFARIKDFEAGIDTVQLSGSIDDYEVKGNQIFFGEKDLVAVLENVGSVDLSSDSFEFV